MPHEIVEQLHSMAAVLDYFEDDERGHYEEQDKPDDHIYEEIINARDGFVALSQLLEAEIRAYGGKPITVADILFSLDDEERIEHFTVLAESLAQKGRLPVESETASTDG